VRQRASTWTIRYRVPGTAKPQSESTGATTKREAESILAQRLAAMDEGRPIVALAERVTFAEMGEAIRRDYRLNRLDSADRLERSLKHLETVFGSFSAAGITDDRVEGYKDYRTAEGAAAATINRELAALKRMFTLLRKRVPHRPDIVLLKEDNRRRGFFEEEQFRAVQARLPEHLQPVVAFFYWTGWRKSEVLGLTWDRVDLKAGVLRLEDSKADEPRTIPFHALPTLVQLLHRQRDYTDAVQQAQGVIVPWVFHRDGKPIRDFRGAWVKAINEAGCPGRIVHDFRRTAARNLSRAGVPENTIMALCGWKTRSVFDRYRIVNERDLAEGLAKLASSPGPAEESKPI
jgi:integrase